MFGVLQALVDKSGDAQEAEILTYLSDFTSTLKVCLYPEHAAHISC